MTTAAAQLDFTPPSLAKLKSPPVFTLRAPSPRDQRQHRRMLIEEGVRPHQNEEVRPAILDGLRHLWGEENYAKHAPVLEAYWQAIDEFAPRQKADPTLEWSYDPEIEAAIKDLLNGVQRHWRPLASMVADNAEFAEMQPIIAVAVAVKTWTGLDAKRELDSLYLTTECAEGIQEALGKIEEENGLVAGTAWTELYLTCLSRTFGLDIDLTKAAEPDAPDSPSVAAEAASEEVADA